MSVYDRILLWMLRRRGYDLRSTYSEMERALMSAHAMEEQRRVKARLAHIEAMAEGLGVVVEHRGDRSHVAGFGASD